MVLSPEMLDHAWLVTRDIAVNLAFHAPGFMNHLLVSEQGGIAGIHFWALVSRTELFIGCWGTCLIKVRRVKFKNDRLSNFWLRLR
jgi:hypothetical protein